MKLWRHGIVEAKSDAGIVFMGSKGGFAEKQGLKIEIKQFKGDTLALKALLAGELDSYEGNPGSPMVAASRGADIKVVGCYWPGLTYAIYSKPDNPLPAFTYDEVKRYSAVDPDMPIPMNKLAWLRDLLVTTGNLTKPVNLDAFVDADVRAKALQLNK